MLTVYGDIRSGNCLKVKWLLDRLGHDYRWVETDVMSGVTRSTDFLRLNPCGQVPAVVFDDGRTLAQSNAILGFFGEGTPFVPADPWERAKMYEWLFWEQYSHEPYVAVVRFQRAFVGKSAGEIEPRLMQRGHAALDRMEQALADRDWLAGDAASLADISLVAYTRMAGDGGFELTGRPRVRAWIARAEACLGLPPYSGFA
ncbi:glutathione S-transferase family protein [Brevundimonas sp. LjRoot202]|uniref:glutathione S-transferase family protein n=1 Tax=Brevundimonas sp. LjRoot202 TaxID=3342281 RepID=UPI003ECF29EC